MTAKIINKKFLVGIIGSGTVAKGLMKLFLKTGISPLVFLRDEKKMTILKSKLKAYQKEKFPQRPLVDIKFTGNLKELAGCNLIIEAIVEDFNQKVSLYRRLKKIVDKNTLIATTTSSLSINRLAKAADLQAQFIGLHFFHPVQAIPFLEIIPAKNLKPQLLARAVSLIKSLNYEYVILPDAAGFVANRILFAMLAAAVELHMKSEIGEEIIDRVARKSLKHPLGPFELINFIGLDTSDRIFHNLLDRESLVVWKKYYQKTKGKKS